MKFLKILLISLILPALVFTVYWMISARTSSSADHLSGTPSNTQLNSADQLNSTPSNSQAFIDNQTMKNIAALYPSSNEIAAYRDFIVNDLAHFLQEHEITSDGLEETVQTVGIHDLRDAYLIDVDNDSAPELILIFAREEQEYNRPIYTVIRNTALGMKPMEDIKLYADGGGTMGRWYGQLLRGADRKVYNHEFRYFHTYDDGFQKNSVSYVIKKYEHGKPETSMDIQFYSEVKYNEGNIAEGNFEINGKSVNQESFDKEIARVQTELEQFEVIIDPSAWLNDSAESIPFAYGMDFLKYIV